MTEKDEAFIGAVTTEDMQRIMGAGSGFAARFNEIAVAPLPLALRQDIMRRLIETKKITPAKDVSEAMIMDAVAQQKAMGTREMISHLVKKKLVTENKKPAPDNKPG